MPHIGELYMHRKTGKIYRCKKVDRKGIEYDYWEARPEGFLGKIMHCYTDADFSKKFSKVK